MNSVFVFVTAVLVLLSGCLGEDSRVAPVDGYVPSKKIPKDLETCGLENARCGSGPIFVMETIDIIQEDDNGHVKGFNLDGLVSEDESRDNCFYEDFTAPDGTPGIDNQITNLVGNLTDEIREALPLLLQNAIGTGGLLVTGELVGVTDLKNDDQVGVVFRRSEDVPLVGTDNLILSGQTFELANNHFMGSYRDGYIENGVLYVGPFDLDLKIQVFGVNYFFVLRETKMELTLTPEGEVETGIMGGSVHLDDIFNFADSIVVSDLSELVKGVVPPFADIESVDSEKCDRISGAFEISGIEAFLFDEVPEPVTDANLSGPDVFAKAGCIGCHAVASIPGAEQDTGPALDGLGDRAGVTDDGVDAETYVRQSILNPEAYVVEGYEDTLMPTNRDLMTADEFETLIAWLLTL